MSPIKTKQTALNFIPLPDAGRIIFSSRSEHIPIVHTLFGGHRGADENNEKRRFVRVRMQMFCAPGEQHEERKPAAISRLTAENLLAQGMRPRGGFDFSHFRNNE